MKKRELIALILILTMVLCMGTTAFAAEAAPEKVYEIKLTSNDAATTTWSAAMIKACENIKERTNGGVDIVFHGNGEMLIGDEGVEAVMSDAAVFFFTDPSNFSTYVPEYMTICAPYLWDKYQTVEAFWETDTYKAIAEKAEAAGVHTITNNFVTGERSILADIPVKSAADCPKLKIRVPGNQIYVDTFAAMGCNYQAMPFSEVYSALETGMLNSVEITPGNLVSLSVYDSMPGEKYYSLNKHMLCFAGLHCGEGFWESLPVEYQDIITEEFAAAAHESNVAVDEETAALIASLPEKGVNVVEDIDIASFQEAVADMNSKMAGWADISAAVEALKG